MIFYPVCLIFFNVNSTLKYCLFIIFKKSLSKNR